MQYILDQGANLEVVGCKLILLHLLGSSYIRFSVFKCVRTESLDAISLGSKTEDECMCNS
jgi:hypothetical protein